MKCHDVQHLLDPYCDGELDLVRHVEIDEHLAQCQACSAKVQEMRTLQAAVASPALYFKAPGRLRQRIESGTPVLESARAASAPPVTIARRQTLGRRLALAAGFFLMVGVPAIIGLTLLQSQSATEDRLAERIVTSHVRSLMVDHLLDVESTDRHTVKPWFKGKLDFAPQVPDLTEQGYALSGGRLDYLIDRPVAALVYFRRLHAINVYVWPAGDDREKAPRGLARQGFHLRHWQQAGLTCWAVSDLNDQELDEFVRRFRSTSAESASQP